MEKRENAIEAEFLAVAALPLILAACHTSTETQTVESNTVKTDNGTFTTTSTTTTIDGNTTTETQKFSDPAPISVPPQTTGGNGD